MVDLWFSKSERELKKQRGDLEVLQKRLEAAYSDCESYRVTIATTQAELHKAVRNNQNLEFENFDIKRQLKATEEEFRRVRNIPMQAEEMLEEYRGECVELREKVNNLNLHNSSLAKEITKLRSMLLWERKRRERTKLELEESVKRMKENMK